MGAYSPAPVVTPAVHARIMREIIVPAVDGMAADGFPYRGFLYAGVMIDSEGNPRTLEFNCRMGDPEAQPIMMRLKTDLVDLLEHAVEGTLDRIDADWDRRAALGVVLAAAGYPDAPRKGAAWTRSLRHCAGRNLATGAAHRIRRGERHTLRRHAVSRRYRPPRARRAQDLTRGTAPRPERRGPS